VARAAYVAPTLLAVVDGMLLDQISASGPIMTAAQRKAALRAAIHVSKA
jgi:hypothetical protein